MSTVNVAILGATGETGGSIINGLIESPTDFKITALTRQSSLDKPRSAALKQLGINVVPYDISAPLEQQVQQLRSIDIVISAVGLGSVLDQIPLATAAKKAGVKRFVPSFYATVSPPSGIISIRDQKEEVLCHIKKLGLGYTVVDIGWWSHGFIPFVPSGRTDYARIETPPGTNTLPGTGDVPTAVTEVSDVGRFVARIVVDPRTLNKMVFMYGDVVTPNQVFDLMERLSGEKVERRYVHEAELLSLLSKAREAIADGSDDPYAMMNVEVLQYVHSWGIEGHNTPEWAEYLGYLNGKELYPDLKGTSLEEFFKLLLDGKAKRLYSG
ncbi:uncharacterized protein LTHEOB_4724 [Neofusicoccum parvum]|uniref:Uncharacterized protein LTHEOB_4724 n=1 Tax=Neofusicoccum parvum TaxID=310453 RepID=A0ACB5SP54_9PEZI|nr:uncharacterized protein LTHEOB_4724 [Neofusicoccum parvum]